MRKMEIPVDPIEKGEEKERERGLEREGEERGWKIDG